jgi:hypothetical protein
MDPRVTLLREFYGGLPMDRAKVETQQHGFAFLETLLTDGISLEYGELTLSGLLHKYKLSGIPRHRMDELLKAHLEKRCNVCLYFHDRASNTFCFNLDNNHKTNNTALIPEMETAVRVTRSTLEAVGCVPLIIASGRGFHIWCRTDRAIDNERLYEFMRRVSVLAMATLHKDGSDHRKIKFNVYPDRRTRDTVSLRLFGSEHAKNRVFSSVLTPGGLLDEDQSWIYFEDHLRTKTISEDAFDQAFTLVMKAV